MLTFRLTHSLRCRSTGCLPPFTTVALVGLRLEGSIVRLSMSSCPHLADSGCRLILWSSRTPCSSSHRCSSVLSPTRPVPTSSLHASHVAVSIQVCASGRCSQDTPIRLGNCHSEASQKGFLRRVSLETCKRSNSNVVPNGKWGVGPSPVCLPLSSQSRASVRAIPLPMFSLLSSWHQWTRDSLSANAPHEVCVGVSPALCEE